MLQHISCMISSTEMVSHCCCKGPCHWYVFCMEQQDAQANSQLLRNKFLLQLFGVGLLLSAACCHPSQFLKSFGLPLLLLAALGMPATFVYYGTEKCDTLH